MRFSSFIKNRFAFKPVGFACLLLGLLALSVMFAPLSQATREIPNVTPQEQSVTVPKRRRPEFVPGEVLVRFKPNQAFEGATYIAVPNNNSSSKNQNFGLADPQEEVRVSVERFGGSEVIEGLRIARTATADTLKAVAALQARDDVLYAEPNYILHADKTPNDPLFPNPPNSGMYGLQKIAAP